MKIINIVKQKSVLIVSAVFVVVILFMIVFYIKIQHDSKNNDIKNPLFLQKYFYKNFSVEFQSDNVFTDKGNEGSENDSLFIRTFSNIDYDIVFQFATDNHSTFNTGSAFRDSASLDRLGYRIVGDKLVDAYSQSNIVDSSQIKFVIEMPHISNQRDIDIYGSEQFAISNIKSGNLNSYFDLSTDQIVSISINLKNLKSISDRDAKYQKALDLLKTMKIEIK